MGVLCCQGQGWFKKKRRGDTDQERVGGVRNGARFLSGSDINVGIGDLGVVVLASHCLCSCIFKNVD